MRNHRGNKLPAEIGNHIKTIAAGNGSPFQFHGEENKKNHCHTESRDVAQKQEGREQNLVKALADVRRQGAKQVAKQPANQDRGQLQADRPHDGAGNNVADGSGILAEGKPEVAVDGVLAENQKLLRHRLIRTELFCITLVNFLHGRGVGHTVRHFTGDGRDRVGRHQPGQKEIEEYCNDKSNKKPDYFFSKIFTVAFHATFPPLA